MTAAVAEPEGIVRRVFRDVLRSIRKAQNPSGIMAALFLPPDVAAELAQPGGVPTDQLHVTLKIFAPDAAAVTPEDIDELAANISRAARDMHALSGNVSGVGRFNGDQAGGGQDVIYATLDVDDLVELYQRLSWICLGDEVRPDEQHDWQPHVTLAYGNNLELPAVPSIPVRFDRLTLAVGGERREYLFAGADVAPVAKAEWTEEVIAALPDASFAVVKADGRSLPYRDAAGVVDLAHLRKALSQVPTADLADPDRAAAAKALASAATEILAKALTDAGEAVAKAEGEAGIRGELELEALDLADDGVVIRAGGTGGRYYLAKASDSGAFTTADLMPGGMRAPQQGPSRRRRPKAPPPPAAADMPIKKYAVVKEAPEQRYTLGVAYPASQVGKAADPKDVDAHQEMMTADELEAAAWRFMASGASPSGTMHKDGTGGAGQVVESYIYRGPTWKVEGEVVEPGDWMLGVVWDETTWGRIKAGELNGYSLQGLAAREPA